MPRRYQWKHLPAILRNPRRRDIIAGGLWTKLWPLLRPAASVYRRTLRRRVRIVGVTGSFGKSTTADTVEAALDCFEARPYRRNHGGGLALEILRIPSLRRHAVLEMGIDGKGQMARFVSMARPQMGIVSGIGSEHGGSLGSLEATQREKAELIRRLPASGTAILNAEDPLVREMEGFTRARVVLCGAAPGLDARVDAVEVVWPRGLRVRASVLGQTVELQTQLFGSHMIFPILAALSAAAVEGIDLAAAARRLGELAPLPGRMQIVPLGCGAVLIDDSFKSAIETIHASFDAVEALPAQRKFLVLGDISEPPGKQGPLGRAVGERIAAIFDEALCIGRHFPLYRRGAERAGMARENVRRVDVGQAIEILRQKLGPGDVVLLKGRDTQRFDRIALGLRGRTIGCDLHYCDLRSGRCARCSLLESGWSDLPRFMKTY